MLDEVLRHDPWEPTYVGTSLGRSTKEQLYFIGALYGFSWPVLASVGAADLTEAEVTELRFEDVRVGEVMVSTALPACVRRTAMLSGVALASCR